MTFENAKLVAHLRQNIVCDKLMEGKGKEKHVCLLLYSANSHSPSLLYELFAIRISSKWPR